MASQANWGQEIISMRKMEGKYSQYFPQVYILYFVSLSTAPFVQRKIEKVPYIILQEWQCSLPCTFEVYQVSYYPLYATGNK